MYAVPRPVPPQTQQFVQVAVPLQPSVSASGPRTAVAEADPSSQLLREQTAAQAGSSSARIQIEEYVFIVRNVETERY